MVIYLLVTKKINENKSNLTNSLVDILLIQNIKDIKIYEPKLDIYSDHVIISTATSNTQMNSALTKIIKHIKSLGLEALSEGINSSWILLQSNGISLQKRHEITIQLKIYTLIVI